jgi:hypothetical protein
MSLLKGLLGFTFQTKGIGFRSFELRDRVRLHGKELVAIDGTKDALFPQLFFVKL